MVDRQKVETILIRRFPGSAHYQVAAAANAIMGLDEEWEEFIDYPTAGHSIASPCDGAACMMRGLELSEVRLFRRREA